jgi:hypothetical protein
MLGVQFLPPEPPQQDFLLVCYFENIIELCHISFFVDVQADLCCLDDSLFLGIGAGRLLSML